jgi:hypothetical protein
MIWDTNSSRMEEPNVDEQEQAIGFCTSIIVMRGIFKGVYRRILGHVMDLTCFTWILNLCWAE